MPAGRPKGVPGKTRTRTKRVEVVQPADPSIRYIPLTKGQFAIVDADDYERLSSFNWHATKGTKHRFYYAIRSLPIGCPFKRLRLHRAVLCLDNSDARQVDHINGDGLDCRKANLRFSTHSENMRNRRFQYNNQTGYKGVSLNKRNSKYYVQIRANEKNHKFGPFDSSVLAAHVYDAAAQFYHKEFAFLNFPA